MDEREKKRSGQAMGDGSVFIGRDWGRVASHESRKARSGSDTRINSLARGRQNSRHRSSASDSARVREARSLGARSAKSQMRGWVVLGYATSGMKG